MRPAALLIVSVALVACAQPAPEVCLADAPSSATVDAPAVAAGEPALPMSRYFELHDVALRPQDTEWSAAIVTLAVLGDGFTLEHLERIDRAKLASEQIGQLDSAKAALASRAAPETPATIVAQLRGRLERAAWADLRCVSVEGTIVPWTSRSLEPFLGDALVRAELERLRDGYESTEADTSTKAAMTQRVRNYAAKLTGPKPGLDATFR
jgi:hypothetical protein